MNGRRGPSRREVLALLAAIGSGMVLAGRAGWAQTGGGPRIVDTHHHIYPPRYVGANLPRLLEGTAVLPASAYTNWSPQSALEQMDKAGVATAVVSMTGPGVWWGDNAEGRKWARECNEFGARMAQDHPRRFGMFAALPLPDTEGSLREITHALDVLKLDGIGLLTSYESKLLGHDAFKPVFDELNRRKAIVFVHPTMSCCGNVFPGVYPPTIEFPTDTTRTITNLLFSGAFARRPDVRFIFSHGGGTLPIIVQRIVGASRGLKPDERAATMPRGIEYELQRQYYDLASVAPNPGGMAAVLKLFPVSQLFYGSDAPFGSTTQIADAVAKLEL